LLCVLVLAIPACDDPVEESTTEEKAPAPSDLPGADFSVTPEMENALFTWVDDDGSFQLADKPEAVPEKARKTVRVVAEGHSPGGPQHVYVVDLTKLDQGGALPVESIPRKD